MQFEQEPQGWDDHIIHHPPGENDDILREMRDRETRAERDAGVRMIGLLMLFAVSAGAWGFVFLALRGCSA